MLLKNPISYSIVKKKTLFWNPKIYFRVLKSPPFYHARARLISHPVCSRLHLIIQSYFLP